MQTSDGMLLDLLEGLLRRGDREEAGGIQPRFDD